MVMVVWGRNMAAIFISCSFVFGAALYLTFFSTSQSDMLPIQIYMYQPKTKIKVEA